MNKSILHLTFSLLLISSLLISRSTFAVDGLSANITASNNYLWRGITQTNNTAAISGGIDYKSKSGLSVGTWVSNASWTENMTYEVDVYANYFSNITKDISYSVGYIHYGYDNAANANFSEVNAGISYGFFSVGYNTLIDSDAGGSFGDDTYITADVELEVLPGLELTLHVGSYYFDASTNYIEYGIFMSKENFTFSIGGTDIDSADGDLNFGVSYTIDLNL